MDDIEELRGLWSTALGIPVDDDTHFFVAGGDSLSGALLNQEVNMRFGVSLTLRQLLDHATFADFHRLLSAALAAPASE